jgi:REP element-mobilizing transposase RayT
MPLLAKYRAPFAVGCYYHVYNHANGAEPLFAGEDDYQRLLMCFIKHLDMIPIVAYCLLPNHLHLLIYVPEGVLEPNRTVTDMLRQAFKEYAQATNHLRGRKGSLFRRPFRRIHVDSQAYVLSLIHYIHYNPTHHGITPAWRDWAWSSWREIIGAASYSVCNTGLALRLFDGMKLFLDAHASLSDYRAAREWALEE